MRGKGLSSLFVCSAGTAFFIFQTFMLVSLLTNEQAAAEFNVSDVMFQSMFMFVPALLILIIGANNINKKKLYYKYAYWGVATVSIAIILGIIQIFIGYDSMK